MCVCVNTDDVIIAPLRKTNGYSLLPSVFLTVFFKYIFLYNITNPNDCVHMCQLIKTISLCLSVRVQLPSFLTLEPSKQYVTKLNPSALNP